jgi:ketosteroid isomerase-like protein
VVCAALEAFLSGAVERSLEFADREIVSVRPPPFPDPQTYHGIDGVLQMYADWTADFDEFDMQALEFTELGDRVLVEVVQRGRGKASGATVVGRFWFLYTVQAGKITRQEVYLTAEEARGAASSPP